MVVIRRELPRTKDAGQGAMACRIESHEDSPLPCATPAADRLCLCRVHAFLADRVSGSAAHLLDLGAFDLAANRPDKAQ